MTDSRGVSEVLGAILVFSILIALLALFQITIVPDQNSEVEFKHNERVQQDMGRLHEAVSRAATTGGSETVSVKTGMRYPTRMLLLNPGPVSGTIRTEEVGNGNITLSGVEATNAETRDYLDGSDEPFATRNLVYDPSYNLYDNAPETTYQSTVLYNDFEDGVTIKDKGNLVSGNRITLIVVDGELSTSSVSSTSLSPKPLSAPTQTVSVTGDGGDITITVPTQLDNSTWEDEILDDEIASGNVIRVDSVPGDDAVDIVLDGGVTYKLRMAKIGVGSGFTEPNAHYLTNIEGGEETILDRQTDKLVVEVRDRFNNPVSGVEVPFEVEDDDGIFEESGSSTVTVETNEQGRAVVTYVPDNLGTSSSRTDTILVGAAADSSFDIGGSGDMEETEFTVSVTDSDADAGDPAASINPSDPIRLTNAETNGELTGGANAINCHGTGSGVSGGECLARITLTNNGGETYEIKQIRWYYYLSTTGPGSPQPGLPEQVEIEEETDDNDCKTLDYQNSFSDGDVDFGTISDGNTESLVFNFLESPGGDNYKIIEGDSFIISVIFEPVSGSGDEFSLTYFVAPTLDDGAFDDSDVPSGC